MYSLADTIIYGKPEDIRQVASQYSTMDYIDEYGYTPLIQTAIINDIEKLKVILAFNPLPNYRDLTGRTALHWSADNNNLEFSKLLLAHKADPNAYSYASEPLLVNPLLRQHQDMKDLLYEHGADLKLAQDYINAKLIGHRFEILGKIDIYNQSKNELIELAFEGFYPEFTLSVITDSLKHFKRNFAARHLKIHFDKLEKIIKAFEGARQLAQYQQYKINLDEKQTQINRILNAPIVLVPISFVGHAIALIQYGNVLVRCDRGEFGREHGTVIFYRIGNKAMLTPSFYKKYLYTHNQLADINIELEKSLQLKPFAKLAIPPQLTGNCSWANMEAAIPAILYLLLLDEAQDSHATNIHHCQEQAFNFFYDWLRWDQDRSIELCISAMEDTPKARRATKAALLSAVLFQKCDYKEDADIDRAHKILSAIGTEEFQYLLRVYYMHFYDIYRTKIGKNLVALLEDYGIDTTHWR